MTKNCLIITGGCMDIVFAKEFLKARCYDYVIAVDAGIRGLKELEIIPDEIVGDLDSADPSLVREYSANPAIHMEVHNPEKDETDTELALMAALRNNCSTVDMLGALGGRIDHEISNIHLAYQYYKKGMDICLYDSRNKIYILNREKTFQRDNLFGTYLSFLPLTERIEGLTLCGFKYPLKNKTVFLGTSLCISNELAENTATMTISKGCLICVESKD